MSWSWPRLDDLGFVNQYGGYPSKKRLNPTTEFVAPFTCPRCGYTANLRRKLRIAGKMVTTWCSGHRGMVIVRVPLLSETMASTNGEGKETETEDRRSVLAGVANCVQPLPPGAGATIPSLP